jgi:hypothetical protein
MNVKERKGFLVADLDSSWFEPLTTYTMSAPTPTQQTPQGLEQFDEQTRVRLPLVSLPLFLLAWHVFAQHLYVTARTRSILGTRTSKSSTTNSNSRFHREMFRQVRLSLISLVAAIELMTTFWVVQMCTRCTRS